jgi:hypothetical protein
MSYDQRVDNACIGAERADLVGPAVDPGSDPARLPKRAIVCRSRSAQRMQGCAPMWWRNTASSVNGERELKTRVDRQVSHLLCLAERQLNDPLSRGPGARLSLAVCKLSEIDDNTGF